MNNPLRIYNSNLLMCRLFSREEKKKKEKKKLYNIIKKIALQSLQELIIKEESGKSKRIEAGHSRIHIFSGQSQDPTHGPSHSAIPKVMLL
jgi:hypothetical protein